MKKKWNEEMKKLLYKQHCYLPYSPNPELLRESDRVIIKYNYLSARGNDGKILKWKIQWLILN